ncbi:MAG: hypothetical protein U5R06_14925 [candidate division KSB1 bacterium]|nr:hypothetical protein [candidate division KSB1 bacterium]
MRSVRLISPLQGLDSGLRSFSGRCPELCYAAPSGLGMCVDFAYMVDVQMRSYSSFAVVSIIHLYRRPELQGGVTIISFPAWTEAACHP